MSKSQARKAAKAADDALRDLKEAQTLLHTKKREREGREAKRLAKRRRSKALRRQAQHQLWLQDDEEEKWTT